MSALDIKLRFPLAAALLLLLAGCETTVTPAPGVAAAKPAEPPMTHTRAATECWMGTEKTAARLSLDQRAEMVDKCIADKMGTAKTEPKPEPKPESKPAGRTADVKKKKPASADANKDKPDGPGAAPPDKPADDKKPGP